MVSTVPPARIMGYESGQCVRSGYPFSRHITKEHLSPVLIASANANAIVIDRLRETPFRKRFAGRNCLLKLSRVLSDITSQVEGVNFLE